MAQIDITDHEGVRTIALNRPDKKNALTQTMYAAMADAVASAHDAGQLCILFTGLPGAFCAGNDVEEFRAASESGVPDIPQAVRFLHTIARSHVPLVAAVDGLAIGIGTTMLLHCDYVVASEAARFATPFSALGLVPEGASTLLAPRLMGLQRAFALLVMGRAMSAQDGFQAGFVNEVVPSGEANHAARKVAHEIARLPPQAVRIARRLIHGAPDDIVARIDDEAEHFRDRMNSAEAKAAFAAFLNRKS